MFCPVRLPVTNCKMSDIFLCSSHIQHYNICAKCQMNIEMYARLARREDRMSAMVAILSEFHCSLAQNFRFCALSPPSFSNNICHFEHSGNDFKGHHGFHHGTSAPSGLPPGANTKHLHGCVMRWQSLYISLKLLMLCLLLIDYFTVTSYLQHIFPWTLVLNQHNISSTLLDCILSCVLHKICIWHCSACPVCWHISNFNSRQL